jgi:hypothetical protein
MRRISCWSTTFQQLFPPIAGGLLTALCFALAFATKSTEIWLAAIVFAVVVSALWRFAPKVRHVEFDGVNIRISGVFRSTTLPLSSITSVTERPTGGFHWATIEFDRVTSFGRRIHFIPRTQFVRGGRLGWRRIAPVVQELAASACSHYTYLGG